MKTEICLNDRWMFYTFDGDLEAEYATGEEVSDSDWYALLVHLWEELIITDKQFVGASPTFAQGLIDAELGADHYKGDKQL